jgi:hypothetical protein
LLTFFPVPSDERLALAERLAVELKRLGMNSHVENLRGYYRRTKRHEPHGYGEWNDAHVVSVARMLRVPPHENDWPVRPRNATCSCSTPRTITHGIFPGGTVITCDACKEKWIELHG